MRPATAQSRQEIVCDVIRVIRRGYANPDLTVASVAAEIATSPRQLQRAMAGHPDGSFRHALLAHRVDVARQLLSDGEDRAISDITRRVGYRNQAQFAKAFRRVTGINPTEYRRRVLARP